MPKPPAFDYPACKVRLVRCDFFERDGCPNWAEYEAWFGRGHMVRLQVCRDHVRESRAYEAHGEAAFKKAEK